MSSCSVCAKNFSSQGNLMRHLKNVHKHEQTKAPSFDFRQFNNKCLEKNCNTSFRFLADLRHHLQQIHAYAIEEEILEFSNEKEFQSWLWDYQECNNLSYVRNPLLSKNKIYFNCNRSGKVQLKTDSRKRALKSQGSCKLGYNCISQIILTFKSDNTYEAVHYKTHYGHEFQIQHVAIPLQTRIDVATKLTNGVSVTKVLDMYRTTSNDEKLVRTNLITRKDIDNIKSSFRISIQDDDRESEINESEISFNETEEKQCLVTGRKTIATELNKLRNNIDKCPDEKLENLTPYLLKIIKNANRLLTFESSSKLNFSTKKKYKRNTETAISKPSKTEEDEITGKITILSEHDYC